ncbi:MAG: di/tricarboxylate transporter [Rickettsiales bacterium]|jgi:di/tricarboxylate transporter
MSENILIWITFAVLIAVFVAFIKEIIEPHIVALTGMVVLLIVGALSTEDMLKVFSNSAPITIACMFVISAALDHTGVLDGLGNFLLKISSKNRLLGIMLMIGIVLFISAFMNNTPVVIILTPVIITLANKLKDYPSKYLIPLSYAAIMGGTCTLIGTSTNILVNSIAQENGQPAFGMFEITAPGLIMAAAGLTFMALFAKYLLPERMAPKDEFLKDVAIKRFLAEITIPKNSTLIGKSINEIKFTQDEDYEIIDLVRKDSSTRMFGIPVIGGFMQKMFSKNKKTPDKKNKISTFRDIPLECGDRITFKLEKDEIIELQKYVGIQFDPEQDPSSQSMPTKKIIVSEGILLTNSNFIGRKIKDLALRRSYGCFALGLHHNDQHITGVELAETILKEGDSLILEGAKNDLERLFANERILDSSAVRRVPLKKKKAAIAIATIIGVVSLSAFGIMPIAGLAMIGTVVVILTGCVSAELAYKTIDWRILLLIFGMLGVGTAMQNTGAAMLLAGHVVGWVDQLGPVFILAAVYLLTSILTEMMTNNAVAIILTPIVISLATTLGYEPRPFIVAIMLGASASFATPIGYQTNTFVYAAGGYKFNDFLKIGIPMNIIMLVVATAVIPIFWPFK